MSENADAASAYNLIVDGETTYRNLQSRDLDYCNISVDQGDYLTAIVKYDYTSESLNLTLYADAAESIQLDFDSDISDPDGNLELKVLVGNVDDPLMIVVGSASTLFIEYNLTIVVDADDDFEDNDNALDAIEILPNREYEGIKLHDDDFYSIYLATSEEMVFSIDFIYDESNDINLSIYNSTDHLVSNKVCSTTGISELDLGIDISLMSNQTYIIKVSSVGLYDYDFEVTTYSLVDDDDSEENDDVSHATYVT